MQHSDLERHSDRVDFLTIGHVTRDLLHNDPESSEYALGGTVSFAAVTARRLGYDAVVVTRAAANVDLSFLEAHARVIVLPSRTTTTFANIYTEKGRVQYCYTPAKAITAADLPDSLRSPEIVLLGPLVGEVTSDVASLFPRHTLVAAVPQGWMRRWDAEGLVHTISWENAREILPHLDVLILSIEDIDGDLDQIDFFLQWVPLVIMTQYKEGSTVYWRETDDVVQVIHVPPRPAREVDPTGAGDIFATAFLLRLRATNDPIQAARYANITASFGVEAVGVAGIPTHQQVIDYMDTHPWRRGGSA
jgi:sugar/nucleoside kinase (ribokinase family)